MSVRQKVDAFFATYPLRKYEKNQTIIQAGEDPGHIFYILKGQVRQYDISPSGNKVVVNVFKAPAFMPVSWAINKTPNEYFFEAADDVSVRVASPDDVVSFLKNNPDVMFDLLARVYLGADGLLRRVAHQMGGDARSRLIFELIVASKRFGEPLTTGEVVLKFSESELGANAGLSRETVSRELNNLKKENLLRIERQKIVIPNLQKLEDNLGSEL